MEWLEFAGLVTGLLCVWLLIRENVWNFPIGLTYALISIVVFANAKLYADVFLNGYYVLMNAYGWYYWLYGQRSVQQGQARVSFAPRTTLLATLAAAGIGTLVMGWLLRNHTDAAVPYWDSSITMLSFAAMWMTARKYIDNWAIWFVVDVIATGVYLYKGIEFYAVLYGVYLVMAVMGWRAWQRSMRPASSSV